MSFKTVTDQLGRHVLLPRNHQRIISIVPSPTELLFDLGAGNRVFGITKFCIHPEEETKLIPKIGGTKQLDLETIGALKPDLIIGNKEENAKEPAQALMPEFPVWMSDIVCLKDAYKMIERVGGNC